MLTFTNISGAKKIAVKANEKGFTQLKRVRKVHTKNFIEGALMVFIFTRDAV